MPQSQAELVKALVDAGVHFGHRASRWNPKMEPYIHGKRNMIHIIDVKETVKGLLRAKKLIQNIVAGGKDVLFVGTKRQARDAVEEEATPLRHALRHRALAGRHADQLPHHPRTASTASRSSRSSGRPAQIETATPRR